MIQLHSTADATIQGLALLIQAEYRLSPLFRDDAASHLMSALLAKRAIEQAKASREAFYLWTGDTLRGVLLRYPKNFVQFGCEGDELMIALCPNDSAAIQWARKQILSMSWSRERITVGKISAYHRALVPTFYEVGLGIDALGLLGSTQAALDGLHQHQPSREDLSELGLTVVPLDLTWIDDVVALRERTFKALPEYCWFGSKPGHLSAHRARLVTDIKTPHAWYVILKGTELVGHFGSAVTLNNPMWGTVGGLELYFDAEFRGRGVARFAYRHTLAALRAHGVLAFKGITAQPPVMHLSKQMGRRLFEIHLHNDPAFRTEHFSMYL